MPPVTAAASEAEARAAGDTAWGACHRSVGGAAGAWDAPQPEQLNSIYSSRCHADRVKMAVCAEA